MGSDQRAEDLRIADAAGGEADRAEILITLFEIMGFPQTDRNLPVGAESPVDLAEERRAARIHLVVEEVERPGGVRCAAEGIANTRA